MTATRLSLVETQSGRPHQHDRRILDRRRDRHTPLRRSSALAGVSLALLERGAARSGGRCGFDRRRRREHARTRRRCLHGKRRARATLIGEVALARGAVLRPAMTEHQDALAYAEAQVAAARDDPAARFALIDRTYHGPTGRAPRHLPFRRAALSFMHWQARRGLLNPLDASPPGSVWWRTVNDRLLRDGCESVALFGGRSGAPSSRAVRLWLEFIDRPTGGSWYRAHNASIVGGTWRTRRSLRRRVPPSGSS